MGAGFGLSVQVVPRGSPALPIWLRTARGLQRPCTYERTCVFICACECGPHVYITVPVWGLGMGCVLPTERGELRVGCGGHVRYERTCVFICVCKCGTHVYSTRIGPGHGCVLPTGRGVRPEFILGLVRYIFASVRAVRCLAWAVRAVYLVCVCARVRRSARAARALYHSP